MFRCVSHHHLCVDAALCRNYDSLNDVVTYTNNTLRSNDSISDMNRHLACDMLGWLLQRHPNARPKSFRELLNHPFLSLGEHHGECLRQD